MKHNDTHLHIHTNDTQTYPDTEKRGGIKKINCTIIVSKLLGLIVSRFLIYNIEKA